ncbi:MAG: LysM peptidoglycan-binding domain-containing protein [Nitrospinae bacterium]|nr:LysM peptidoglycan-binding domain-containing protein [Nitrospinota bacterium]
MKAAEAEEDARKRAEEETRLKAEEETRARAAEKAKVAAEAGGKASHEVVKGESLWKIAKYKDVYKNPFMWPLIYKANHDKINDPDLIYPKQIFSILRDFPSDDKDKAVRHAKTRGEWSLHDGPEKYWEPGYKKK